MRIIRQPVYHEGTFKGIVRRLWRLRCFLPYAGRRWMKVQEEEGVSIYREADCNIAWLRERMEEYEHYLYSSLAGGFCGRDGILRGRTRDVRRLPGGGFGQR